MSSQFSLRTLITLFLIILFLASLLTVLLFILFHLFLANGFLQVFDNSCLPAIHSCLKEGNSKVLEPLTSVLFTFAEGLSPGCLV